MRATTRALRLGAALTVTATAFIGATGFMYGIDHDPHLQPTMSDTVSVPNDKAQTYAHLQAEAVQVMEDDPTGRWNCLTMGNLTCGPDWQPITSAMADSLAEGTNPGDDTRDWETCLIHHADRTIVICHDGTVLTW
jgi:hypothetical protein